MSYGNGASMVLPAAPPAPPAAAANPAQTGIIEQAGAVHRSALKYAGIRGEKRGRGMGGGPPPTPPPLFPHAQTTHPPAGPPPPRPIGRGPPPTHRPPPPRK